ncbi:hypothetical protein BJ170DRAFT_35860 [Xylariales sp. AK1849]|nr:hypothetical protein BJ170DRAFT_35860 [Xylariales sp. AK1849]
MSIQQLPDDVVAQIKSSTTITSLNGVICGLIKNSLDSNATKITAAVDYARGNCSVEDNGTGIPPAEFGPSGGLGKLHYTSTFPARSDVHGSSGTFLASVAALSLLSITSHHHGHRSHNTISIHNSKVLARHTPSPPEQRFLSFSHGTRAAVRDLFGSMPVRVKQRAVIVDKASSSKDWDYLKLAVVALLLPWPGRATISIRDSANQQTVVIKNSEVIVENVSDREQRSARISRVSKILCQAGLSEETSSESWVALKASAGQTSISGAVCLTPVATRRIQFISIGIQPVSNERGSNVLYEEVNRLFVNSSFGVEEELRDIDEVEQKRRTEDLRYKTDGYTGRELKGRKGIDRWPMFHLHIDLGKPGNGIASQDLEEALDGGRQSLKAIVDVLRAMIYEFLKKYHFRPIRFQSRQRGSPRRTTVQDADGRTPSSNNILCLSSRPVSQRSSVIAKDETKASTGDLAVTRLRLSRTNESQSRSNSPFDGWTRIKSGRRSSTVVEAYDRDNPNTTRKDADCNAPDRLPDPPLLDSTGNLMRAPFSDSEILPDCSNGGEIGAAPRLCAEEYQPNDDAMIWVNPVTRQRSVVDARTGFITTQPDEVGKGPTSDMRARLNPVKRLRTQPPQSENESSAWLEDLLSSWQNPIFDAVERRIPVAFDETKFLSSASYSGKYGCHHAISDTFPNIEARVSKDALREAEVVAQVDRKFILARVPLRPSLRSAVGEPKESSLLVIIDQHAADERCRAEALMSDYFVADSTAIVPGVRAHTEGLDKPLQYELSISERSLFERYASLFEYWGIVYHLSPVHACLLETKAILPSFLKILRLPSSIVERCRMEPRLLIDLLRKEVWKLDDGGRRIGETVSETQDNGQGPELHWLSRFHDCPQGVLDMINSRACRCAIMFNDVLTLEDCKDLLRRLADCAFPFQCAHGRPSMVPLVDLGDHRINRVDETGGTKFGKQFKRWKTSIKNDE